MVFGVLSHPASCIHRGGPTSHFTRTQRRKTPFVRSKCTWIRATSEHWWEDEQEFDAVTETLHAKRIYLVRCTSTLQPEVVARARTAMEGIPLQTAFTSAEVLPTAEAIWEGRSVPPHFFKLRTRDSIQANPAVFLDELLRQNWKVELDYGLGGSLEGQEAVLVVSTEEAVDNVVRVAKGCVESGDVDVGKEAVTLLVTQGTIIDHDAADASPITLDALLDQIQPQIQPITQHIPQQ